MKSSLKLRILVSPFIAFVALAGLDAHGVSKEILEECTAQVKLINAEALKRLARKEKEQTSQKKLEELRGENKQ